MLLATSARSAHNGLLVHYLRGNPLKIAIHYWAIQKQNTFSTHFLLGNCKKGAECPFPHINVDESARVCLNFQQGYCSKGSECTLKHEKKETKRLRLNKRGVRGQLMAQLVYVWRHRDIIKHKVDRSVSRNSLFNTFYKTISILSISSSKEKNSQKNRWARTSQVRLFFCFFVYSVVTETMRR